MSFDSIFSLSFILSLPFLFISGHFNASICLLTVLDSLVERYPFHDSGRLYGKILSALENASSFVKSSYFLILWSNMLERNSRSSYKHSESNVRNSTLNKFSIGHNLINILGTTPRH